MDVLVDDPLRSSEDERLVSVSHIAHLHHRTEARLHSPHVKHPVKAACEYLRSFCSALQLQVLRNQANHLAAASWAGRASVRRPEHHAAANKRLIVDYWLAGVGVLPPWVSGQQDHPLPSAR